MAFIDLTHPFRENIPVFPGDKTPAFRQVAEVKRDGYNAYRLETGMHIGTHMDAPLHMIENGKKLTDYPIDFFTGSARVLDVRGQNKVEVQLLEAVELSGIEFLLLQAGWDTHFGKDIYYRDYPEITPAFAHYLTGTGVRMIGLDWPSPDRSPYEVHRILLGNDILIIENLRGLEKLPEGQTFRCHAFPYTYDIEGSPVRVVAEV